METYDALCRARWLIGQRRYAEARALLATIQHAQAAAWLARLDEIERQPFADHGVPLKRFAQDTRDRDCEQPRRFSIRSLLAACFGYFFRQTRQPH